MLGLSLGREHPLRPVFPAVHRRVPGLLGGRDSAFVKLVSVDSSENVESSIAPDRQFAFSVPVDGKYLLLLVESPYNGPSIEIEATAQPH